MKICGETVFKEHQPNRSQMNSKMTGISKGKPEHIVKAQQETNRCERKHFRALRALRRQAAKAAGLNYKVLFPSQPLVELPGPKIRTGLWRCRTKQCRDCSVRTCKSSEDPDRRNNSCPCHSGRQCDVWDQIAPCTTSYEAVPPTKQALAQGRSGQLQLQASPALLALYHWTH